MRIDSFYSNSIDGGDQPSKSSRKPETSGPVADRAVISSTAGMLRQLRAKLETVPEVRQDKVEALQRAMRSGSYELDPGKIADAMLKEFGQ